MARILVVEDSLTIISEVESQLRRHGHRVTLARNGLTALAAVRAFSPELMLLDILLPHMDGFAVCHAIRRNKVFDTMPIIMMTGLTNKESIERASEEGANGYLAKPVSEEKLLATIDGCLAHAEAPVQWQMMEAVLTV